jgi:hypothetical protein
VGSLVLAVFMTMWLKAKGKNSRIFSSSVTHITDSVARGNSTDFSREISRKFEVSGAEVP